MEAEDARKALLANFDIAYVYSNVYIIIIPIFDESRV